MRQKTIRCYLDGEKEQSILVEENPRFYSQEERSIPEIANSGDREYLDFALFDFGNIMQTPKFIYQTRDKGF